MTNLTHFLTRSARRDPHQVALSLGSSTVTYGQLDDVSARIAGDLRAAGLQPGQRIALMLPNTPAFVALYYGVLRAGGIVVPVNPLLKEREVRHYLNDSGAALVYTWGPGEEAAAAAAACGTRHIALDADPAVLPATISEPLAEPDARKGDDTAVIIYTSGTSGRPKGAELSHTALASNVVTVAETLLRLTPDDVVLGCLPLFHIFGQSCAMNAAVFTGATLRLVPRFAPDHILDVLTTEDVTVFEGVPTMYAALLHRPHLSTGGPNTLRLAVTGGAALPVEILRGAEKALGCPILEGFGMSETSPVVSFNHPDRPAKPGSIGTPVRHVEMRVLATDGNDAPDGEVGELAVRGPNLMKGYWNLPEETKAAIPDGWLRTGDLARKDEDGYYYIVDRKKDMIIRGGYNIYPREIEEVLYEHPAVAEAAVIGIPDDYLGEEVAACVVLRPGAEATADELIAFVQGRVAPYKYPRRVWLSQALPKGPTGKILKREIIPPAP
ncbi:long-chain fatty acid--CoA ligase [Kitasatospora sp. NPDC093550]|uniref:long-chain-fatty-acid--CoA ligase n=1 Tax=Kitasatospora sp. NPDC093550 TaxID=3364089 RepID=UPI0037F420A3